MVSKAFFSAAALFTLALAQNRQGGGNNGGNNGGQNNNNGQNQGNNGGNDADSTTLSENAIQTGSFSDGSEGLGAEDGQAASATSQNNFINECAGKTLTNGLQITEGSCNGIRKYNFPRPILVYVYVCVCVAEQIFHSHGKHPRQEPDDLVHHHLPPER